MGLFDFVQQNDAKGLAANNFGQLPPALKTNVARRRPQQSRNGVLLHVFAHIQAHHQVFTAIQNFGQGLGQLGLANSGRAQKDKRTNRPSRIFEPTTRPSDCFGHAPDSIILINKPLVNTLLQLQKFVPLRLGQFRKRHPRHLRNNPRHMLLFDLGNLLHFGLNPKLHQFRTDTL